MEELVHWFVVISQKETRIFIKTFDGKHLRVLKSLTNPLGEVKRRELIRKQAGRGVKSIGRVGSVSYSQPKRHDPHDEAIIQFAKAVCHFLKSEKLKKNFDSLTVVAEPYLLGKIKVEMSKHVLSSVTKWIKKDLQKLPQKKLADFLLPLTNLSDVSIVG